MFKKWLAIFQKNTLLDRAYTRSYEMLDITREMYLEARNSLRHTDNNILNKEIRSKDIAVNQFEREVRRNVVYHLTTSGAEAIPSGLILVSIIIDIERIGDYTKNMVDLAMNHTRKLQAGKFEEILQKVETAVEENFSRTRDCFESGDAEAAMVLLKEYGWVNRDCDACVMGIVKEEDSTIGAGQAGALALYFRWLKRINSHLNNITTSVVNPFDRIGFVPKKSKS